MVAELRLLRALDFERYKKVRNLLQKTENSEHFGGPEETRTLDLSDANRTLSQLSYRPLLTFLVAYMRTVRRTLALHPQIWGHRFEPFALPAELQAHFYELFEGEPRGSRMRYNTIAKTVPLALPAELQAHL